MNRPTPAASRRSAAGVGRFISEHYRDSLGFSDASVRYQMRRYFREQRFLEIEVPQETVKIEIDRNRETATAALQARVRTESQGQEMLRDLQITLRFAREPVYYFWVIPGEEWKVTSAEGYAPLADGCLLYTSDAADE